MGRGVATVGVAVTPAGVGVACETIEAAGSGVSVAGGTESAVACTRGGGVLVGVGCGAGVQHPATVSASSAIADALGRALRNCIAIVIMQSFLVAGQGKGRAW